MDNAEAGRSDRGQADEFLDLLARHEPQIMGFIWSIVGAGADADDLFQQSVMLMWQKLSEYRPDSNFVAWACQIAKLQSLELYRKRKKILLLDQDVIEKLAGQHAREDYERRLARRRALSHCLLKLPEKDRTLVETCYQGERTIRDTAEQIGRSARSVYKSLARIRKTLFHCILVTLQEESF